MEQPSAVRDALVASGLTFQHIASGTFLVLWEGWRCRYPLFLIDQPLVFTLIALSPLVIPPERSQAVILLANLLNVRVLPKLKRRWDLHGGSPDGTRAAMR
ncbi:MAG: hypothetical protein U0841_31010 [Chloroflexia bacterium]